MHFQFKTFKTLKNRINDKLKIVKKKLARLVSACVQKKERVRWRECVLSQNHVYQKSSSSLSLSLVYMSIINFQHYKCHVTTSKTADFDPVYE